jgi:prophage regulatory protein
MNPSYLLSKDSQSHRQIARLPEVEILVGYKRSAIYERVKNHTFPAPIKLGPKRIAWLLSDVQSWLEDRISEGSVDVKKMATKDSDND